MNTFRRSRVWLARLVLLQIIWVGHILCLRVCTRIRNGASWVVQFDYVWSHVKETALRRHKVATCDTVYVFKQKRRRCLLYDRLCILVQDIRHTFVPACNFVNVVVERGQKTGRITIIYQLKRDVCAVCLRACRRRSANKNLLAVLRFCDHDNQFVLLFDDNLRPGSRILLKLDIQLQKLTMQPHIKKESVSFNSAWLIFVFKHDLFYGIHNYCLRLLKGIRNVRERIFYSFLYLRDKLVVCENRVKPNCIFYYTRRSYWAPLSYEWGRYLKIRIKMTVYIFYILVDDTQLFSRPAVIFIYLLLIVLGNAIQWYNLVFLDANCHHSNSSPVRARNNQKLQFTCIQLHGNIVLA